MAIYKNEKNNTWYYKSTYKDVYGKTRHVTRRGFQTKNEARKAEADFILNKKTELKNSIPKTFGELYDEYHKHQILTVKESSYITVDNKVRQHILPYFSDKKLTDITVKDIQKWHQHMLTIEKNGKKYSISYLQTLHSKFATIINFAIRQDYIKYNVVSQCGNFQKSSNDWKEMSFFTFDEFRAFENALENDIYKLLFKFLYFSGVRLGEALALSFNDFANDFSFVKINKTLTAKTKEKGSIVTPTKTPCSIRTISLPKELKESCMSHYLNCSETLGFTKNAFFFGVTHPLSTTTIERKKNLACSKIGIKQIRIHDFRHSHASLLINNGVAPIVISKRLGHKSLSTTLEIYVHMFSSLDQTAINTIDQITNSSK